MKFFIDTANIEEIKKAHDLGLLDGVTTNPSLVSKEGREFEELISEICGIVDGPVNAEVVSTDAVGMIEEAKNDARAEGERMIDAARAEIDQEVNRAKEALRAQVATLVINGAEQVLESSVDAGKHGEMLDKLAAEL